MGLVWFVLVYDLRVGLWSLKTLGYPSYVVVNESCYREKFLIYFKIVMVLYFERAFIQEMMQDSNIPITKCSTHFALFHPGRGKAQP